MPGNTLNKSSIIKPLWDKIPIWLKLCIAGGALTTMYRAWHIEEVNAQLKPFKSETRIHVEMIYQRQDDLQRSFNYLEERIDKHNSIILDAVLRQDKK